MGKRSRTFVAVMAVALTAPFFLSACDGGGSTSTAGGPVNLVPIPTSVAVTPATAATKLPVTTEIGTVVSGGEVSGVTLVDAAGRTVTGEMRQDGSAWVPSRSLDYSTRYTATVSVAGFTGSRKSVTTSFTTMAQPTEPTITAKPNVADKATYGIGMPIVVTFSEPIPAANRADVERRLVVTSTPAQVGIWSWTSSTIVAYRPERFWQTGTTVTLDAALQGLPVGDHWIAEGSTATFTIGRDQRYDVDAKKHVMTVSSDGKVLHTYPISAGKSSTPSWSGKLVIMQKFYYTVFNTMGIPGENYITPVHYAERLTWSGTYFHSAPWSVGEQGSTNVSHGCINLAPKNAKWMYENSQVGDPVNISGTPIHVAQGNGWTAWDLSWTDFAKGSAIGLVNSGRSFGAVPAV
jgi:lipoprotein-anchoring transpeptidase ErfK/SrfK